MVEAKRRIGLFLTIAFLLSILVAGLVYQQVSAVEAELGERVSIYVAAREIPAQVLIEATDLEPVEVPRAYLQPGMVTDPKLATGKVSLLRLKKGELLHQGALVQRVVIPPESRVLRLYRTQTLSFDDNLLAGDQVDLVVTLPDPAKKGEYQTNLLLAAVPVVEVDAKQGWVGLLLPAARATEVIGLRESAKQIHLLRVTPKKEG
jgi:Flp pilus assembly protein CpaB